MSGPPMFFDISKIPEAERKEAWQLQASLMRLDTYARNFLAAIQLYDFCLANSNSVPVQWMAMAGRDAAMTLYHFDAVMEGIVSSMHKAPTVRKMVDHNTLRLARKGFDAAFPNFENLRHAVAHHGELRKDTRSTERNSFTGDYTGPGIRIEPMARNTTFVDCSQGRLFTTTFEGQMLTYELSASTYEKLLRVVRRFFSGFNALVRDPVTESPELPPEGQNDRQPE